MPVTYENIATTTLGSNSSTISFNSIPSSYTDLRLVILGICPVDGTTATLIFNSNTSAIYSGTGIRGTGSSAVANNDTSNTSSRTNIGGNNLNTVPSLITADIFSYTGSTAKTILYTTSADQNGSGLVSRVVSFFNSTAAISSITLSTVSGAGYATGTTATLYGIKNA